MDPHELYIYRLLNGSLVFGFGSHFHEACGVFRERAEQPKNPVKMCIFWNLTTKNHRKNIGISKNKNITAWKLEFPVGNQEIALGFFLLHLIFWGQRFWNDLASDAPWSNKKQFWSLKSQQGFKFTLCVCLCACVSLFFTVTKGLFTLGYLFGCNQPSIRTLFRPQGPQAEGVFCSFPGIGTACISLPFIGHLQGPSVFSWFLLVAWWDRWAMKKNAGYFYPPWN